MADFGVKVTPVFELENSGFIAFKKELQDKLDDAAKDAKLSIKNITFDGNAKDITGFVKGLQDAIGQVDLGKSINLGDALHATNQSIDQVNQHLHRIGEAVEYVAAMFSRLGENGEYGLRDIIASLQEINSLVNDLNNKDFSIQNVFNTGDKNAARLDAFKTQAVGVLGVLRQMRDASQEVSRGNITSIAEAFTGSSRAEDLIPFIRGLEQLQRMDLSQFSKRLSQISDVSSVRDLLMDLQRVQSGFEEVYGALQQIGVALPDIDTSGLQAASSAIANLGRNGAAAEMNETADAANRLREALGIGGEGMNASSVNAIKEAFGGMNATLDTLREKIRQTFDMSEQIAEAARLGDAYSELAVKMGATKEVNGTTRQTTDAVANQLGMAQIEAVNQEIANTLAALDAISGKIEAAYDFTKAIANSASFREELAQLVAMTNALQQNAMAASGKFTTVEIPGSTMENLATIAQRFNAVGSSLDELKSKIASTFDFSQPMADADALSAKLQEMRGALELVRDVARIAQKAQKNAAAEAASAETSTAVSGAEQTTEALHEVAQAADKAGEAAKRNAEVISEAFTDAAANIDAGAAPGMDEATAAEAAENIQEILDLYRQLTDARDKYVNAMGTTGNKEFLNVPIYKQQVDELEAAIDSMLAEHKELQDNEDVINAYIKAEQDYEIAINKVTSALINQQVAAEEKDRATAERQASKQAAQEEKKELTELINLMVRLEAVRTDVAKAYRSGDDAALAKARGEAEEIRRQISAIIEKNAALEAEAQANQRVADAVYKHDQAINAMDSDKFKQEAAEVEKLQKALAGLQVGSSGIKFGGNADMVSQYEAELKRAEEALQQVESSTGKARTAAVDNFNEIIASVKALKDQLNAAFSTNKADATLNKGIETLKNQWITFTNANSSWYQKNKGAYDKIFDELSQGASIGADRVQELRVQMTQLNSQMKVAGAGGKTFFQTMKEGWQRFGGWSIVTRSFTKVISTFKQAVTAVKEVDSAMTELRKVTDETEAGYERLYGAMEQMATRVGAKLSDTINATANFSRLGYDAEEALKLSEAALTYFNVGDQLENIGEATESLISTIKAFGVETSDVMSIVDKFNEVGN